MRLENDYFSHFSTPSPTETNYTATPLALQNHYYLEMAEDRPPRIFVCEILRMSAGLNIYLYPEYCTVFCSRLGLFLYDY